MYSANFTSEKKVQLKALDCCQSSINGYNKSLSIKYSLFCLRILGVENGSILANIWKNKKNGLQFQNYLKIILITTPIFKMVSLLGILIFKASYVCTVYKSLGISK